MKIAFIVNGLQNFITHRYSLAKALQQAGHEIILIGPKDHSHERFLAIQSQITFCPLAFNRKSLNPFNALKTVTAIKKILEIQKPDIVITIALKASLFANFAKILGFGSYKLINLLTGLGFVFTDQSAKVKIIRFVTTLLYKISALATKKIIFQNNDDYQYFLKQRIIKKGKGFVVPGSGIDLTLYSSTTEPEEEPAVVLLPARLLKDKGVYEFVEAAKILKNKVPVRMVIAGEFDQGNPSAITEQEMKQWQEEKIIEYWGFTTNIQAFYQQANIICLPSYREGLPKVLLEAGACVRAVITTNVPGCREVVTHDYNGLLFPVRDSNALANAIKELVQNKEKRQRLAQQNYQEVKDKFSNEVIIPQMMKLILN